MGLHSSKVSFPKFLQLGNQSSIRCTACAEFTERIKSARGDERAAVLKAQELHIGTVRQYRCAQTRINHMSEDAVKAGRADNHDEFIKVDIDACDEAKFKCPRNTSNAKSLEGNWRPQLHLHGALVWGVPSRMCFSFLNRFSLT